MMENEQTPYSQGKLEGTPNNPFDSRSNIQDDDDKIRRPGIALAASAIFRTNPENTLVCQTNLQIKILTNASRNF